MEQGFYLHPWPYEYVCQPIDLGIEVPEPWVPQDYLNATKSSDIELFCEFSVSL